MAAGERAAMIESAREIEASIEAMRRGLEDAPAIYQPGEYWDELIAANIEMLRADGIENLKRTVSNNYYNWLVTGLTDQQLHRALRTWLEHPSLAPLTNRMQERATGLRVLNKEQAFALSRASAWRYKFFVGTIWELASREDPFGLTARVSEPEVGNPIRISHRGRLISQDLANGIIELGFVARSGVVRDGARVGELGAGYGRLAHVYAEACPLVYCIFDIPPTLAVAQWYLTRVLGPERIVPYDAEHDFAALEPRLRPGVVAFFTPDQLELFPDGWLDCMQTISTLPEMPRAQAMHYLRLMDAKTRRALFFKQWQALHNTADDSDLAERDYAMPAPWRLAARRVDPVHPGFFNQLWLRD
jgi:putative sugar O-methyltransferase